MQSKEGRPYRKNHINLLKMDDKRRRDRNVMLLSKLENIEKKAAFLQAKTDRIRSLKSIYKNHFNKIPNTIATYNRNNFYDKYIPMNDVPILRNDFRNYYENDQYRQQNIESNMIPTQQTQCFIKNITLEEAIEEISKRFVLIPKSQTKYPKTYDNPPKEDQANLPTKEHLSNTTILNSFKNSNEIQNLDKNEAMPSINNELSKSEESCVSDADLDRQNETNQISSGNEKCDEEKQIDSESDFEHLRSNENVIIDDKPLKDTANDKLKKFNNVIKNSPDLSQKVEEPPKEYNKQELVEPKIKIDELKDESQSKLDVVVNENVERIGRIISKEVIESEIEIVEDVNEIELKNNGKFQEQIYEERTQYDENTPFNEQQQYRETDDYQYDRNDQQYENEQVYQPSDNNDQVPVDQIYEENVESFDIPQHQEDITSEIHNDEQEHVDEIYEQRQETINKNYVTEEIREQEAYDPTNAQDMREIYDESNEEQLLKREPSEGINEAYEQSEGYKEEVHHNLEYSENNVSEYNPNYPQNNESYDNQNTIEPQQYTDNNESGYDPNYTQNNEAYEQNVNYDDQNYNGYNNYQPYAEDQSQYNTEYDPNAEGADYQYDPNNPQYVANNYETNNNTELPIQEGAENFNYEAVNPDNAQNLNYEAVNPDNAQNLNYEAVNPDNAQNLNYEAVNPDNTGNLNYESVNPNNTANFNYEAVNPNNTENYTYDEAHPENIENFPYDATNTQQYQDYQGEQNQYDQNAPYDTQYNENVEYSEHSAELNTNQNAVSENYMPDGQTYQNQTNDSAAVRPLQILESDVEPFSNKEETSAQESDFDFSVKK